MRASLKTAEILQNPVGTGPFVEVSGVGLHTGRRYSLRMSPTKSFEAGIHFRSRFEGVEFTAPALWTRVSGTARATALVLRGPSKRRLELRTVEHFLAAALVAGFRSLDVEVVCLDGETDQLELPALDGSSGEWLERLAEELRRVERSHAGGLPVYKAARVFELADKGRSVRVLPLDTAESRFSCRVDYGALWKQSSELAIDWTSPGAGRAKFFKEIAPARTFGFQKELEMLAEKGLARGGSFENALLLDDEKVVNPEGFRVPNELAAHKLLDAVGDFALLGAPVLAAVECVQAGHQMHLRAVEEAVRSGALIRGRLFPNGVFLKD